MGRRRRTSSSTSPTRKTPLRSRDPLTPLNPHLTNTYPYRPASDPVTLLPFLPRPTTCPRGPDCLPPLALLPALHHPTTNPQSSLTRTIHPALRDWAWYL
eukprot:711449-Rhodomonas_salina.1